MSEDASFLKSIVAAPGDDLARLAYADWLEDQRDPRAEYIRLRLKLGEPRGRKRILARLSELAPSIEGDWRRQVFSVPKLTIARFVRVKRPIKTAVTKWGGQPVWLAEPAWPLTPDGRPMRFICQIRVPDFFGTPMAGKMVYVFVLTQDFDPGYNFDGNIEPLDPEGRENAVVIQPGGDSPAPTFVLPVGASGKRKRGPTTRVESRATGPALFDKQGRPAEWQVELAPGADPDYTPNRGGKARAKRNAPEPLFRDDESWERYYRGIEGQKIGGTPAWGNGRASEIDSLAVDPDWRLLLS
jgi:uncharacterized protein (TIGR02996 family)